VGAGALDAEAGGRRQQLVVTLEHRAQRLELGAGPAGERVRLRVRRPSQKDGGARVAVGHGLDVHGSMLSYSSSLHKDSELIYMGT
jgi:hypothetical protein